MERALLFVLSYGMLTAAAVWIALGVFCLGDPKFDRGCGGGWLYFPLLFLMYLPLALVYAICVSRLRGAQGVVMGAIGLLVLAVPVVLAFIREQTWPWFAVTCIVGAAIALVAYHFLRQAQPAISPLEA